MKRILIAIMFVIGFSAVAQAKIVHLKCGGISTAIDTKKKKIFESSHIDEVKFFETEIYLKQNNSDFHMVISRIDLSYRNSIRKGTCQMGRKF